MPVRPATVCDASAIAAVHVASWQTTYRGIVPEETLAKLSVTQRAEMWRQGLASGKQPVLVMEENGQIVGFAAYGPTRDTDETVDTYELYAIYLLAESQRQGRGGQLWHAVKDAVQCTTAPTITVWVLADNRQARAFYEKCGFIDDGAAKTMTLGGKELRELRYRLMMVQ